jgi:integrase
MKRSAASQYASPTRVRSVRIIGEKIKRDRVLDDDEIRAFVAAATAMAYPWGSLALMLLFSACRLREIAEARWGELDAINAMLIVPASRMKGKREHSIPFTRAMQDIIGSLPKFHHGQFLSRRAAAKRQSAPSVASRSGLTRR